MGADVLVVAEHLDGALAPSNFELVAKARVLASASRGRVAAALLGSGTAALAEALASRGIEVLHVEDPALAAYTSGGYVQALQTLVARSAPRAVLVAHTAVGYDVAPALAAAADLAIVTNCVDVALEGDVLVATRRMYNEKIQGEFEVVSDRTVVVTLRPGSVAPAGPAPGGAVTPTTVAPDPARLRARFVRLSRPEVSDVDLAQADVIVSAGRGIQKKENLALVEALARRLGGVVGASRPLTDNEWLPKSRQVGQSGRTVRPKLYVACGISGAMQHVSGMKDAGLIVAINTDPSAPIFEVAHVGFVANVLELLPAVLKELGG
ncbi:MAG: electron transfer flavoprotein subunit alpha/FixB family protein [Methanobacteriota archaeon]